MSGISIVRRVGDWIGAARAGRSAGSQWPLLYRKRASRLRAMYSRWLFSMSSAVRTMSANSARCCDQLVVSVQEVVRGGHLRRLPLHLRRVLCQPDPLCQVHRLHLHQPLPLQLDDEILEPGEPVFLRHEEGGAVSASAIAARKPAGGSGVPPPDRAAGGRGAPESARPPPPRGPWTARVGVVAVAGKGGGGGRERGAGAGALSGSAPAAARRPGSGQCPCRTTADRLPRRRGAGRCCRTRRS